MAYKRNTPIPLVEGGTNASLTANNGGVLYSTASAAAILASTATANQPLLSGASGAPGWSTATYPGSTTANRILYSSSNNVVDQLVSAANGALVTNSSSVPSILAGPGTTGNVLQSNSAAAPSFSTATYPATTTVSQILYSSATNTVAGLATANRAVITTNSTGVPVATALATDGQLIIGSTAGAPAAASLTAGTGITITPGSNAITIAASGSSFVVQQVRASVTSVVRCTTAMPFDDTIPQNTEGNEFLTVTITPTNTNNVLRIDSVTFGSREGAVFSTFALFQDSTAGALAAVGMGTGDSYEAIPLTHYMTAGTISATTFKMRAGVNTPGAFIVNGEDTVTRKYGGVASTKLIVTEMTS